MLALIGLVISSIFRGTDLDAIFIAVVLEIFFIDWWLLPMLVSKL